MITVREVAAITALNFGLEPIQLIGESRDRHVTMARHVAMYVAIKLTGQSEAMVARGFNRDHSSVAYGIEKIETELAASPRGQLAALIQSLRRNVEFRQAMEAAGGIDVLTVARRIAASPVNNSIGATTMETAALAATVLDLWEIALAAEELARLHNSRMAILSGEHDATSDHLDPIEHTMDALSRAIPEELAAMRGETNNTNETNKQENQHGEGQG